MVHLYMKLNLQIPEADAERSLTELKALNVDLTPPGLWLVEILDKLYFSLQQKPLRIFETGCIRNTTPYAWFTDGWSSFYLAKWKQMRDGHLVIVDIDPQAIDICSEFLQRYHLSAKFLVGDSIQTISTWRFPVDVFFLDACDGLEHGLEEFKAALKHNPYLIIMDDWDAKVQKAAEYAQEQKIPFERYERYTLFYTRVDNGTDTR